MKRSDPFQGHTVFVVGGGASLSGFRWDRLAGRYVCAINRAYEVIPGAQMLYWSDAIFFRPHRDAIMAHGAPLKAALDWGYEKGELPADIVRFRKSETGDGRCGFDPDPSRLFTFNNSAGAALHVLAHMRPSRIVLLGVDMRHGSDGRTHWHSGHNRYVAEETLTNLMLPHFEALRDPMAERGIEVLNAINPDIPSALEVWPKITIEEAMGL